MLRRLIRDFLQLHHALKVHYAKRARAKLTPEQEVERLLRELHRHQDEPRERARFRR